MLRTRAKGATADGPFRLLRHITGIATKRKCSARMSGFYDSDQRDTYSPNAPMLGRPLQSRPPSFQSWTGNTGSEFTEGRAASAAPLYSKRLPSRCDIHSWWAASRVPAGEICSMKDRFKTAECIFCGRQAPRAGSDRGPASEGRGSRSWCT